MTEIAMERTIRGRAYLDSLRGRHVVVVGLARSGVAAARLLLRAGARVTAADAKRLDGLGADARALGAAGARIVAGGIPASTFDEAELVVVSPGVPFDAPDLRPARAAGVPIIGELELGWRATEADTIAITGTNGKTTTTALVGALVAAVGRPVLVGGNIGTPLASGAAGFPADGIVVCEVSSFQLETVDRFHPRVAAVLNVAPDHLDRHGSFAAYVAAKGRIFENQTAEDWAVLNADDETTRGLADRTAARIVWWSRRRRLDHGVFVDDDWITARIDSRAARLVPIAEIPLRGAHNVENVLAAVACALWAGVGGASIRREVARFQAVAHRIEPIRVLDGVQYYNDSKGTNVDSTIKALESFPEPVLLIAGGRGKGQDFAPLAAAARGRVRHAILIGEDAPKLASAFDAAGLAVLREPSLAAALTRARSLARPGDVVLLSPACASFDMFDSYEHRGDVFRSLVRDLV